MKKFLRILTPALFLAIAFLPEKTHGAYPLGTELIYYKFEETATGTTTDAITATTTNSGSGGSAYDGTLVGNASTSAALARFGSRSGVFGEGIALIGDYMRTYYGNAINPTTSDVSVSFWVNKNNNNCTSDADHVFGVSGSPTANRFYIRCNNSTTNKWGYRIQGNSEVFSSTIQAAGWDHIVLVASSTNDRAQFYVNGSAIGANVAYTTYSIPGHFYVGNYNDTVGSVLTEGAGAYIDEVMIYNTALTPANVTALYKAGDGVAPVISAIATSSVTQSGITVTWTTDENASTQIEYGTTGSYGSLTTEIDNTTYVTSHSQAITGLSANTLYHYRVVSKDPMGTTASSTDGTFTTSADAAPTITNISSDKVNGTYGAGSVVDIDLTFSEAVTATTSVTVTLETGTTDRTCTFTVSNSTTATCNYTVQTGDVTSDLTVNTVSGYIEDQANNPMTNFAPTTNLAANKAIVIGEYISFVSPTISANSTTTSSSISVYASSTMQTTSTSTTQYLTIENTSGSTISTISTTTRYGDYNLTHLTNVIADRNLAITANSSSAAYVPTTNTFFVTHNVSAGSDTTISELDTEGVEVRSITCTACGDIEGITLISSVASSTVGGFDHTFMISTENNTSSGRIFRIIVHSTGAVTVNANNYFDTGIVHGANTGLEGIAYNSTTGVFYVAEEDATETLYEVTLGSGNSATATTICSNLTWAGSVTDFSDLAYNNGILYVLTELSGSALVPVNITSTSTCAFVDSDGDGNTSSDTGDYLTSIPVGVTDQAEGVTWDSTGDYLYVIGEADFMAKYRTNAYTTRHTFTGISNGSYILKASSTDATTGLITHSPFRDFGVNVDSTAPTIANVSSDKANGTYGVGEVIDIDVVFSENVTSTGNVTVTLETGTTDRTCTFSVSNASTGTCNYTVQAGDSSSDLTVNTISGTIADQSSNAMSDFAPATNLAANKALVIDAVAPIITSVASSTSATTATVTWTTTGDSSDSKVSYGTGSGTYTTSTSSATLTTSHSLGLTSLSADTLYYFVVVSKDALNNIATSSEYTLRTTPAPDVTAPTIANVSSDKANGTYGVGEVIDIDVVFSENVTSTGNVTVTLETGTTDRTCTFSVSNASTGTCNYTVQAGDSSSDLTVNTISGTIADQSSNAMSDFAPATNLAANKALVIDAVAPQISSVATSSLSSSGVTVTWTTDENATSTVEYGTTSGYGSASTSAVSTTNHSITLTGLSSATLYHFRVSSGDAVFNYATSSDGTFTTSSGVDATPPTVSVTAPSAGTISGTVPLAANASDNVSVAGVTFYIDGIVIGSEDTTSAYTGSLDSTTKSDGAHTIVAVARDTSNNLATSTGVSVTIDNSDNDAPSITNIASSTTATRATITWDTNESATSTVFYGPTSSYGSASSSSVFVTTDHSIVITGLANSTTYHFQVSSGDASNNYATSSDLTFRTTADTGAPEISNVDVTPSNTSITFTWETDELASSMVAYGPGTSLGATTTEADTSPRVLSHSVTVSDLIACTRYFFRIASTDATSNTGYDVDSVVSTTGCTGSADIEESEIEDVDVAAGGDMNLVSGDQEIELNIPADATATSSTLVFQIKIINDDSVIGSIDSPSGTALVNGQMYDIKAYINATTTLDTFDEPITVTLTYSDDDVDGIDESTLSIYRYDGGDWIELDDCDVDEDANTITCTTDHFSVFGLFGDEAETGNRSGGSRRSSSRTVAVVTTVPTTSTTVTNPVIEALLARIAELQRQLALLEAASAGPATPPFFFVNALKFGDNNPDVWELQKVLNMDPETVVALTGPGSKGNETTYFGNATKAAVIKFQLKHAVISSASDPYAGVVGPKTRAQLNLQ